MPVNGRHIKVGGADVVIWEEDVGSSSARMCFPGISSCISVTAPVDAGLMGTHITFRTDEQQVADRFDYLNENGAANAQNIYVIGRLVEFKGSSYKFINTRKKIRNLLKASVSANATVQFYDTSAHNDIHVFAEILGGGTNFSWINSAGNMVLGPAYPDFQPRTAIAAGSFVIR